MKRHPRTTREEYVTPYKVETKKTTLWEKIIAKFAPLFRRREQNTGLPSNQTHYYRQESLHWMLGVLHLGLKQNDLLFTPTGGIDLGRNVAMRHTTLDKYGHAKVTLGRKGDFNLVDLGITGTSNSRQQLELAVSTNTGKPVLSVKNHHKAKNKAELLHPTTHGTSVSRMDQYYFQDLPEYTINGITQQLGLIELPSGDSILVNAIPVDKDGLDPSTAGTKADGLSIRIYQLSNYGNYAVKSILGFL